MASVELDIDKLDIGQLETIEGYRPRSGLSSTDLPRRLCLIATDGTQIQADLPKQMPADAIELVEFFWESLLYGNEGDDCEEALAAIRAAKADQNARDDARRAA